MMAKEIAKTLIPSQDKIKSFLKFIIKITKISELLRQKTTLQISLIGKLCLL